MATTNLALRPAVSAPTSKTPAYNCEMFDTLYHDAAMMAELLPHSNELESQEETHNTWTIEDWGSLQKKELGKPFQCGSGSW
ncbi:ubiquitin-specific protease ubp15 [Microsporum canis]